ncbi:GNAT family N-acetyltransferase [Luedemannella flava]|uniref:GNAT family N-acetyltransferase n=1 Tax=Luedemannella flava TaxID=349316 RepID=A0ABP4YS45_9ACTN
MIVFRTERLDMRRWGHADHARLFDTYSRWDVAGWLGATPRALASIDEAAGVVDRWAARADGIYGVWAVVVRETGVIAGTVLLVPLPDNPEEIEVGWHFHPDSWGNGYATEAARGAILRGFLAGLPHIYAVVRPDNTRSLAVCHRLGMTPLGRTNRWYGVDLEAFRLDAPTP